jgi:hypothetical protein
VTGNVIKLSMINIYSTGVLLFSKLERKRNELNSKFETRSKEHSERKFVQVEKISKMWCQFPG